MAFDFERYLHAYQPESADFRNRQSCQISLSSDEEDILPVGKNGLLTSKQNRTCLSFFSAENKEKSRLLDALSWLDQSEPHRRLGLERIESRFQSHQDSDGYSGGPGNKQGLSKQKSLPASFSSRGSDTTKAETRRRRRSSVRFADEIGENLTTFLMIPSRFDEADAAAAEKQTTNMTSSRNSATRADDQRNSRTTDGDNSSSNRSPLHSSAAAATTDSDEQTTTTTTLFQLCFDQPAADFSEFRRRLSLQFVCLENARIEVKSQTDGQVGHVVVVCSIKVRNIHPVKRVFARCTDNGWVTYADISAAYVNDGTAAGRSNEFDTFTFALSNPLRSRVNRDADDSAATEEKEEEEEGAYSRKTAAVEFALCYQVLGTKYWDNNNGRNYRIVWMQADTE